MVPKIVFVSVASWETNVSRSTAPIGRGRICFKEIVAKSTSLGYLDVVSVVVCSRSYWFCSRCCCCVCGVAAVLAVLLLCSRCCCLCSLLVTYAAGVAVSVRCCDCCCCFCCSFTICGVIVLFYLLYLISIGACLLSVRDLFVRTQ